MRKASLNVCKFYVESPLTCVSGITGADLKRRIVRIMTEQVAHKLDLSRKLLLCVTGLIAVATPIVFGLIRVNHVHAQSTTEIATGIVGTGWQGYLCNGSRDHRTVLKVSKQDGKLRAAMYWIDEGGRSTTAFSVTLLDSTFKADLAYGNYEGKLSADGTSITGTWTQGSSNPTALNLVRATTETAWAIPEIVPEKAMAADANPSFEVATIKPNNSGDPHLHFFYASGRNYTAENLSLSDLICITYGLRQSRIVGERRIG